MNLQTIALRDLVASEQPRPIRPDEVDRLAASIKDVGLIQPIVVKPTTIVHGTAMDGWKLVAGHHRVAACRALGWTEIAAVVVNDTSHLQNELIEIDENLCRAELTAAQRTAFSKRRKQIWEALHPEIQVGQVVPPVIGYASPPPQTKGFAAATEDATGQSKRDTNRAIARADAIGDEALAKVVNTSLDSGVELDALAKLAAPERAQLIERAAAGEQVSARQKTAPQAAPTRCHIHTLSADIRKALHAVLADHGCLNVAELTKKVSPEVANATQDQIDDLDDLATYLNQWLQAILN